MPGHIRKGTVGSRLDVRDAAECRRNERAIRDTGEDTEVPKLLATASERETFRPSFVYKSSKPKDPISCGSKMEK